MTDVRSLSDVTPSAAGEGPAKSAAAETSKTEACRGVIKRCSLSSYCRSGNRVEFFRVGEDVPDRFARRQERAGQRRIAVLDEREHLEDQDVVGFPQRGDAGLVPALVMLPELFQQIIHLVTERELGEHADGVG